MSTLEKKLPPPGTVREQNRKNRKVSLPVWGFLQLSLLLKDRSVCGCQTGNRNTER